MPTLTTLVTKGLVGGGSTTSGGQTTNTIPPEAVTGFNFGQALEGTDDRVTVLIPTAPNMVLLAAENITLNLRVRQASSLSLPSMYKRAYLVAYETDEIAIVKP